MADREHAGAVGHTAPQAGSVKPVPSSSQAGTGCFASGGPCKQVTAAVASNLMSVADTEANELEAIVAHGLLNSLAVMSGAAGTLLAYGHSLEDGDVDTLVAAIDAQSCVFTEGLKVLLEHSSVAFADAATAVSLGSGICGSLSIERRDQVLDMLVRRSRELKSALDGLVRGLPPEVLELLDSLNSPADITLA